MVNGQPVGSSFCDSSACVEVARVHDVIMIYNSNDPETAVLATTEEWEKFLEGVKAGEFNLE